MARRRTADSLPPDVRPSRSITRPRGPPCGLAITLSAAALILVLVYVVGGYATRVVIEVVDAASPAALTVAASAAP
jgi:hypothetical protein